MHPSAMVPLRLYWPQAQKKHTWSAVCHREHERPFMLELKIFVIKLGAINGFPTSAIAGSEVSSLYHELLDNSVEGRACQNTLAKYIRY
jgi:hypothetical protein